MITHAKNTRELYIIVSYILYEIEPHEKSFVNNGETINIVSQRKRKKRWAYIPIQKTV